MFENPYQPPATSRAVTKPWWQRFLEFFFAEADFRTRFLAGESIIQYGVLFYVDPQESGLVYAALPISTISDDAIQRNVNEAKREFAVLLTENLELVNDMRGRMLAVRMVANYRDYETSVVDPVVIDWANG